MKVDIQNPKKKAEMSLKCARKIKKIIEGHSSTKKALANKYSTMFLRQK